MTGTYWTWQVIASMALMLPPAAALYVAAIWSVVMAIPGTLWLAFKWLSRSRNG